MSDPPLVLTVEEAAQILRISRGSAYEAVRRGEIPSVKIGRTIRIPRDKLLSLIDLRIHRIDPSTPPRSSTQAGEEERSPS